MHADRVARYSQRASWTGRDVERLPGERLLAGGILNASVEEALDVERLPGERLLAAKIAKCRLRIR